MQNDLIGRLKLYCRVGKRTGSVGSVGSMAHGHSNQHPFWVSVQSAKDFRFSVLSLDSLPSILTMNLPCGGFLHVTRTGFARNKELTQVILAFLAGAYAVALSHFRCVLERDRWGA